MADARTPVSSFPAVTSALVLKATLWTKIGQHVRILMNALKLIGKLAAQLGPASIYSDPIVVYAPLATKRPPPAAMVIESQSNSSGH